jgi:DtxR family Mn-dependent transcriptional regulator
MYLLSILRLGAAGRPVPLSELADVLGVSPVSVNQMCHKLHDEGLVEYVPYQGVSVTIDGARLARRILRRHRLWEVFLVEHLQMDLQQAHGNACELEHATSDEVIERLAQYLSHPTVNPEGDPIPDAAGESPMVATRSLAGMDVGERAEYVQCDADETCRAFLTAQGLRPGTSFQVVATAADSVLLGLSGRTMALSKPLASAVRVTVAPRRASQQNPHRTQPGHTNPRNAITD